MFFGCIVKENKPYNFNKTNNITHLSEACLGGNADNSKIYLKILVDDCEYNLCVLQKNRVESYKLDHFIGWGKHNKTFKLLVSGGGPNAEVHITGYVEMEDSEDNQDFVPGESLEIKGQKEISAHELDLNEDKKEAKHLNGNKKEAEIKKDKKDKSIENKEKRKEIKTKEYPKTAEHQQKEIKEGQNINKVRKENKNKETEEANKIDKKDENKSKVENEEEGLNKDLSGDSDDEEIENLLKKKRKTIESEKPKSAQKPDEIKSHNKKKQIKK